MKNGDRLSGSVLRVDGKNLLMKSELAGQVTIPWDAVVSVHSSTPLTVGLKDGQVVVGPVSTVEGKLVIDSGPAGRFTVPKDAVEFMRSKEEQAAYQVEIDRLKNPRLVDLWTGFLDLGLALARGNSLTSTYSVSANASRATSRDKMGVHFTSLYASNSTTGVSVATANALRGGVNYNLNLTSQSFTFGSVDLEFDEFQKLDLRFAPAGGFGYRLVKNERTTFDLQAGASLNREFFSTGLSRTSGEALVGEEFIHKLNSITSLRHKLVFYPNLTQTGEYRMNFDTSAVTNLRRWMAWQFTISDRFLSNPVTGRKRNDVMFTTGIRLTFAR